MKYHLWTLFCFLAAFLRLQAAQYDVPFQQLNAGGTYDKVTVSPVANGLAGFTAGKVPTSISRSSLLPLATTLAGYGITDQSALQTETVTYVANVRAAGGDVGQSTIQAIDQFIVDLKRDSLWNLFVEIYPFVGTNLNAALVKLKNGTGTGTSLTNNGFVAADYSQEAGFGIPSGNTSKFLNTGFIPSNFGISCANLTMFGTCTNDNVVASASSGAIFSTLKTGNTAGSQIYYVQIPQGTGMQTVDTNEQGVGNSTCAINFYAANSTTHHANRNGVRTHTWSQASSTTLPDEVGLFKGCYSSSNNRFGNGVVGMCGFGTYATPAQGKLISRAVYKFERAIGRTAYQYKPTLVWNGDSISAGQGATNWYDAFHALVSRQLGMLNYNVAQPAAWGTGDTGPIGGVTSSGDIVAALPANTAVVMYGTNDMGYSVTSGTYTTAITSIINNYVSNRWRVILCTAPYVNNNNSALRRSYAVAVAGIAKTNKIPFVDCDRIFTDLGTAEGTNGSYMADGSHPNTAGHALIAERILKAFQGIMVRRLTITFTSVAAASTNTQTVEVLNAVAGNTVTVTPDSPSAGIVYSGTVTSNDTVTVSTTNITAGAITPTTGLVSIEVR
jgi:lysophospholipase L1-like esterase